MNRLETINFQNRPFMGKFYTKAEMNYKGYFHTHGGIELLFVHKGSGSVTVPQHVYRMEPGSLFLFQPYQLHHVRAIHTTSDPYVRSVLQFDPIALMPYLKPYKKLEQVFLFLWKGKLSQHAFLNIAQRYPIEQNLAFFQQYIQQEEDESQQGKTQLGNALLDWNEHYALLIISVLQFIQQELDQMAVSIQTTNPREMSHTEAILTWIEKHFTEPFELERLANELHLSKYYISHLFKEETGHTVTEYLLALRSKEACYLLMDESLSVAEVGERVGWPIPSHFIKQFKRWVGCTPLQYRKRNTF